ncbi:MAG: PadR family transcriptional regulator [Calothrix sp. MO_167.B12]|nr:PadR family transcriptional regulator [Calothrix sp. MO_167.B12]
MGEQNSEGDEALNLSAIEVDILSVLVEQLYGLDILNRLNCGRPIALSFGSLYGALNRLEKKRCIEWRWGGEQEGSGGARRKYYKATRLGKHALNQWRNYRSSLNG